MVLFIRVHKKFFSWSVLFSSIKLTKAYQIPAGKLSYVALLIDSHRSHQQTHLVAPLVEELKNAVSTCTAAVHYNLKYYMHGSPKFTLNYCRAQNFKMLRARQSIFHQKILPRTILRSATCTPVWLLSKNTTAHHTSKRCMHGSLYFTRN